MSLNAAQALEKRSRRACSSFSLCATRAASSAKRRSRSIHLRTLVLARSLAGLNNFPSERVRSRTPSTAEPKACFRRMEKKIVKSVGANAQPCLTPMLMSKASDELPSNLTVPRDPSWKDLMKLRSFGGQVSGKIYCILCVAFFNNDLTNKPGECPGLFSSNENFAFNRELDSNVVRSL